MNINPASTLRRTSARRRMDAICRVRELCERLAFDEEVSRTTRQLRSHSNVELNMELPVWKSIYEESLEDGDPTVAMHALASIEAIDNVLDERKAR